MGTRCCGPWGPRLYPHHLMISFFLSVRRCLLGAALLLCVGLPLAGASPDLTGDWHYRGFFAEARAGGSAVRYSAGAGQGTMRFTALGGGRYRAEVLDSEEAPSELTLQRVGNVFAGDAPLVTEGDVTTIQRVQLTVWDDYALLVTLVRRFDPDTSATSQHVTINTYMDVLSREAFPEIVERAWSGEYAPRMTGIRYLYGDESLADIAMEKSVSLQAVADGVDAMENDPGTPSSWSLQPFSYGVSGDTWVSRSGPIETHSDLVVTQNQYRSYALAVQLAAGRVAWLRASVVMGVADTGGENPDFLVAQAEVISGISDPFERSAPVFTRQPRDVAVLTEGPAFLSAQVTGVPTPSLDWEVSTDAGASWTSVAAAGLAGYEGAQTATLAVQAAALRHGARYRVQASNAMGGVTSEVATLKLQTSPSGRLPNLSVRSALAAGQRLTVGFVMNGGSKPLLMRAIGPGLGPFGVGNHMPDPRVTFYGPGGGELAANDDWPSSLAGLFEPLGAFGLATGSKDAALQVNLAGASTAVVTGDEAGVALVEVYDVGEGNDIRLANVSARNRVGTGNDVLIAGFVVQGADAKTLLVRGIGPALARFGLQDVLGDPLLEIFNNEGDIVASSDNWRPGLRPAFIATGAFDLSDFSLDAALVVTLPPGPYSALLRGVEGDTGEGLIEIYELP